MPDTFYDEAAIHAAWRAWLRQMSEVFRRDGRISQSYAVAFCASDDVGPDNPDEDEVLEPRPSAEHVTYFRGAEGRILGGQAGPYPEAVPHAEETTPECERALRRRTLAPTLEYAEGFRCGWLDRENVKSAKGSAPASGVGRNLSTPEGRAFWKPSARAEEVKKWPAWKRAGININPSPGTPVKSMTDRRSAEESAPDGLCRVPGCWGCDGTPPKAETQNVVEARAMRTPPETTGIWVCDLGEDYAINFEPHRYEVCFSFEGEIFFEDEATALAAAKEYEAQEANKYRSQAVDLRKEVQDRDAIIAAWCVVMAEVLRIAEEDLFSDDQESIHEARSNLIELVRSALGSLT